VRAQAAEYFVSEKLLAAFPAIWRFHHRHLSDA
jgi:hypothetical protein